MSSGKIIFEYARDNAARFAATVQQSVDFVRAVFAEGKGDSSMPRLDLSSAQL